MYHHLINKPKCNVTNIGKGPYPPSNITYQAKFEKVTYGENTFKYYGSHI